MKLQNNLNDLVANLQNYVYEINGSSDNVNNSAVNEPVVNPVQEIQTTSIEQDSSNENIPFATPVQPMPLTDDNDFHQINEVQNSMSASNFIDNSVNKSYMLDDEVKFDDEGEIEVQIPSRVENKVAVDMKTVINTIRECASVIEKYGYRVETDELDLADSYEVTFRIEKDI